MTTTTPTQRWTVREILLAAFLVVFCAVQLSVPLVMLGRRGGFALAPGEPVTGELPFSWQMYTVTLGEPEVIVEMPDGSTEELAVIPKLGELAGRAGYDKGVLRRICAERPDAIRVTYVSGAARATLAC